MHEKNRELQPGLTFLNVWQGCLAVYGVTANEWCRQNGVGAGVMRQAATGATNGPKAKALREKMIAFVGQDMMIEMTRKRLQHQGLNQ